MTDRFKGHTPGPNERTYLDNKRLVTDAPNLLTAFEAMREALSLLTEICAAMADPEHCMHTDAFRMNRVAWGGIRDKGRAALALSDKVGK